MRVKVPGTYSVTLKPAGTETVEKTHKKQGKA
jgi:hypothetical protein